MTLRGWLGSARPVVVTFTTVALLSMGALGLLSWQLLEKDRDLDAPRLRGLVESAADRAVPVMAEAVARLDAAISREPATTMPEDVSWLVVTQDGAAAPSPGSALPFVPVRRPLPEADPLVFAEATAVELVKGDTHASLALYRGLATRADRAIRAGALARLAPINAKLGDLAAALRACDELAGFDDVSVGGLPGGLVASAGRATVLADAGQTEPLRAAATSLVDDLQRGRWQLSRAEHDFYSAEADRWIGRPAGASQDDGVARADAAVWAWNARASLPPEGRRLLAQPRGTALVVWRISGERMAVVTAGPVFLSRLLTDAVPPPFVPTLRDLEGRAVLGAGEASGEMATRVASPTGLPWTLELRASPTSTALQNATPRRLLLLVLSVTMLMVGAGWYFIARALAREGRVSRLQQAFVASVSHEFRSPLTSIAHLSDLLSKDRLATDDQRRHAYDILVSDAARLRDMVENLLDFSRFDAATVSLRCERLDVGEVVTELVNEARRRVAPEGYTIEFTPPAEPQFAEVDRAAFGRAVWNLIENAVKYSPQCRTVWVEVERDGAHVSIAVRDRGLGIPASEQEAVFRRFVRGAESQSRHIRGTGIGLALVRQIVEAHGGEVRLTSQPGQGSRFVVVLHTSGGTA